MLIISSLAFLLSITSLGWVIWHFKKATQVQNQFNASLLEVICKQNSCFESGLKCLSESQSHWLQEQVCRANHDSACLHYILAALRPYLFTVLDNAVKHDLFEDAAVCREMIGNIDRLIQTDFTKFSTK